MKTERIEVRVSQRLHADLVRVAKRRELTISELVRECLETMMLETKKVEPKR